MKKLGPALLIVLVLVSACSFIEQLLNPFIGTWTCVFFGITTTLTFRADNSCSWTETGLSNRNLKGTYSYTEDRLDITWSDGTTASALYSIDGSRMTWTPTGGGLSVTFIKQ